jgi:hypothetical protein
MDDMKREGVELARLLYNNLAGGTFDAMLGELARINSIGSPWKIERKGIADVLASFLDPGMGPDFPAD